MIIAIILFVMLGLSLLANFGQFIESLVGLGGGEPSTNRRSASR